MTHTICSHCREVVCSLETRCSECQTWSVESMQEYLKYKKSLAGKCDNKPAVTAAFVSQPAVHSSPLESSPSVPSVSEDSRIKDAVLAVLQSLSMSGSLGINQCSSTAPSTVPDYAPSVGGATGVDEGMKLHNVYSLSWSSGVGALDNPVVSTSPIVHHDLLNVYQSSARLPHDLGNVLAAPVAAPVGHPLPPLASSGDYQLRVPGRGPLDVASSSLSPNSLLFPLSPPDSVPPSSSLLRPPLSSSSSGPLPSVSSSAAVPSSFSSSLPPPPFLRSIFLVFRFFSSFLFRYSLSSSIGLFSFPYPFSLSLRFWGCFCRFLLASFLLLFLLLSLFLLAFLLPLPFPHLPLFLLFFLFSPSYGSSSPFFLLFLFGFVALFRSGGPPGAVVGSLVWVSIVGSLVCYFWGYWFYGSSALFLPSSSSWYCSWLCFWFLPVPHYSALCCSSLSGSSPFLSLLLHFPPSSVRSPVFRFLTWGASSPFSYRSVSPLCATCLFFASSSSWVFLPSFVSHLSYLGFFSGAWVGCGCPFFFWGSPFLLLLVCCSCVQWRSEGGGGVRGAIDPGWHHLGGDTIEPLRLSRARLTPWSNPNFTSVRKISK